MLALGRGSAITGVLLPFVLVGCDRAELDVLPAHAGATAFDAAGTIDHVAPPARSDAGRQFSFPECTIDEQCGSSRYSRCDTRIHRCVECLGQADCPLPTVCDLVTERCAIPCQTSSDCSTTAQTRCDTSRNICVGCTSNDQCAPTRFCEPRSGQCVECLDSRQCDPWLCSPYRNECVECLDDQHCPPGEVCGSGHCLTR